MRSFWKRTLITIAAAGLSVGLVACGDDDDQAAVDDTPADGADDEATQDEAVVAYCEYSASLDEGNELPTDEEFDELAALAPAAIESEMDTVVTEIQEKGEAVFADESNEEFFSALETIEAFEEENCRRDDPDTEQTPADSEE